VPSVRRHAQRNGVVDDREHHLVEQQGGGRAGAVGIRSREREDVHVVAALLQPPSDLGAGTRRGLRPRVGGENPDGEQGPRLDLPRGIGLEPELQDEARAVGGVRAGNADVIALPDRRKVDGEPPLGALVVVEALCGPGDDSQPVITIMVEGED